MYPDSVLEQIKTQLNIVDVVSKYVNLKKIGRSYQGLCPFHAERTPSFFVNPELNIFKCFGCGIGGDIFKFVQEIEKISFRDAVEKLAKQAGVELPRSPQDASKYKKRKRVLKVLDVYSKFFQKILFSQAGKYARDYLYKRGLTPELIQKFKIGFAPSGENIILKFAKFAKFELQDLVDAGLLTEDKRPRFRYRIMFPLLDNTGKVIGFSGRTLSSSPNVPKYLNSPETIVFKKRFFLFGLYWAKHEISKQDMVILTEGQMDVLSSMRAGVGNIVAPLGTALTETQLMLLKRFTNNIAFAFDNDAAGEKALFRAVVLALKQGFTPYVVTLPKEVDGNIVKDIDELVSLSDTIWQKYASSPKEFFELQIQKLNQLQDKSYNEVEPFLQQVLEILVYASELRQELIIKQIAQTLDITIEAVKSKFLEIKRNIQQRNVLETIEASGAFSKQQVEYNSNYILSSDNSEKTTKPIQYIDQPSNNISEIVLQNMRESLEKYITTVILHYPILVYLKDIKQEYKNLFYYPEYKAFIEYTIKILREFLAKLDKSSLEQAKKGVLEFYEIFLQNDGVEFYSSNMNNYFRQTNFYDIFTELAALQPPFDSLDSQLLKDFNKTWIRFKTIVYKLQIKNILNKLDELESAKVVNVFLVKKLNEELKALNEKLQALQT